MKEITSNCLFRKESICAFQEKPMMILLAKRVFQCMSISHHILTVASEAQLARYNVQDSFLDTENIISHRLQHSFTKMYHQRYSKIWKYSFPNKQGNLAPVNPHNNMQMQPRSATPPRRSSGTPQMPKRSPSGQLASRESPVMIQPPTGDFLAHYVYRAFVQN